MIVFNYCLFKYLEPYSFTNHRTLFIHKSQNTTDNSKYQLGGPCYFADSPFIFIKNLGLDIGRIHCYFESCILQDPRLFGSCTGRTQVYFRSCNVNDTRLFWVLQLLYHMPPLNSTVHSKSTLNLQYSCQDSSLFGSCSQDTSLFESCTSRTQGYLGPYAARTQGQPWVLHTDGSKVILGPVTCRTQGNLGPALARTSGYFGSYTWQDPRLFWVLPNLNARLFTSCPSQYPRLFQVLFLIILQKMYGFSLMVLIIFFQFTNVNNNTNNNL